MIAARRAFCFFVNAMISPANPPATKNATLAAFPPALFCDVVSPGLAGCHVPADRRQRMGGRADLPAALCGPPWCDQIPTPTENQLYPYSEQSCAPRHSLDSRKLFVD
jgi:hypothetical protein